MEAGFLGVGNMGLPMAGKLLDGGHQSHRIGFRWLYFEPRKEALLTLITRRFHELKIALEFYESHKE